MFRKAGSWQNALGLPMEMITVHEESMYRTLYFRESMCMQRVLGYIATLWNFPGLWVLA